MGRNKMGWDGMGWGGMRGEEIIQNKIRYD